MTDHGARALVIAQRLWPQLVLVMPGSWDDRLGVDAYDGAVGVQIKGDERIADSRKLYHEIYEKSAGRPDQRWRHSPAHADAYIFITRGGAVRVAIDVLAIVEIGLAVTKITETSIGLLIPLTSLPRERVEIRRHDLWDTVSVADVPRERRPQACWMCHFDGPRAEREINWSHLAKVWLCAHCYFRHWDGVTVLGDPDARDPLLDPTVYGDGISYGRGIP